MFAFGSMDPGDKLGDAWAWGADGGGVMVKRLFCLYHSAATLVARPLYICVPSFPPVQ